MRSSQEGSGRKTEVKRMRGRGWRGTGRRGCGVGMRVQASAEPGAQIGSL